MHRFDFNKLSIKDAMLIMEVQAHGFKEEYVPLFMDMLVRIMPGVEEVPFSELGEVVQDFGNAYVAHLQTRMGIDGFLKTLGHLPEEDDGA